MPETPLLDFHPATDDFLQEVLAGLRNEPRSLPCKFFYDERGSQLFDRICELDEYYLTRAELMIMEDYAAEMAEQLGPRVMLVEYGSGSSVKTRLLLDKLINPAAYVPVDISREHLRRTAGKLSRAYPQIEVLPVCADFTQPFELPVSRRPSSHAAVYFPGSTIGNFTPDAARTLIRGIARMCGLGGGLLIGIDLQKSCETIDAAYNDAEGVTAEFNLNLLRRINRELDGDFDLDAFEHRAAYNSEQGRVEIGVVSCAEQTVTIAGESFAFEAGDAIATEYSHKYTVEGFSQFAAEAGLALHKHWTDAAGQFGVLHFVVDAAR